MPLISLQAKARLQNVHLIYCPRDYEWCCDVEDPITGEHGRITFKGTDNLVVPNNNSKKRFVNFWMRWKQSNRIASITLHHMSPMHYEHRNEEWCDFAYFKCVGLKITNVTMASNFHVMDADGVIYDKVVGARTEWVETNPNLAEDVRISDLQFRLSDEV